MWPPVHAWREKRSNKPANCNSKLQALQPNASTGISCQTPMHNTKRSEREMLANLIMLREMCIKPIYRHHTCNSTMIHLTMEFHLCAPSTSSSLRALRRRTYDNWVLAMSHWGLWVMSYAVRDGGSFRRWVKKWVFGWENCSRFIPVHHGNCVALSYFAT